MTELSATGLSPVASERRFFARLTLGIALLILFGFGQFAARGIIDYRTAPLWFHAHGAVMTGWLALSVIQSTLAARGDIALHRQLGWLSLGFVIAIPVLGTTALVTALRGGLVPPFYTPAFFLLLNAVEFSAFLALVALAILRRRETSWHARALLCANVVLMDPALGRLLPMPLLGAEGLWLALIVQAIPLGLIARHDARTLGRLHPATLTGGAVVLAAHAATLLVGLPIIAQIAAAITA